jgi:peptidoglycan/xylan/chitin deacetylase (PgdA/CDA1 family)
MRYVIVRDDDTNAFTPAQSLERLYRPFLSRGFAINLATIPEVTTNATMADGRPEGFLVKCNGTKARTMPVGANQELVQYLLQNPGYHIAQHGCYHNYLEFDRAERDAIARRLDHGTNRLLEAGFPRPRAFVAPYDKLSSTSFLEVAARFPVLSTGWFEFRRLPYAWWPGYLLKKYRQAAHWRISKTLLLSHPGCLLSYQRDYGTMLDEIIRHLKVDRLTVLVTHWWEYFRNGQPDELLIEKLHQTASYIASQPELKVISFDDLANANLPLN